MKTQIILLAALASLPLFANDNAMVNSPDGKLEVSLGIRHGRPYYSVTYDGLKAINNSLLGLTTNELDLTRDLSIKATETSNIDERYKLDRSKTSEVHYVANRLLATLATPQGQELQVEFRVSNNDVAFRYLLPKQGETGSVRVTSEATSFSFPESAGNAPSPVTRNSIAGMLPCRKAHSMATAIPSPVSSTNVVSSTTRPTNYG